MWIFDIKMGIKLLLIYQTHKLKKLLTKNCEFIESIEESITLIS